ncbi:response regulator transcription factor [Frankia sp. CNm7]|uniref:Response regulator transcription factor n=1 Tax=Frankia nepalensis TaxID=1836974 RepID=A0A937R5U3_9ACTN|nr:response regulator transcription factor [Frankia nepalensis]MBL7502471.1 response regulator transcription factor [Frankia nepalensis]MBL7516379.1 response regulator transcription factor [Frankia nepalensis]MBL7517878.1 response regulator transcription factor [Frankia nepalensis]MBL7625791.1 response regulator transcription factor [Frankia nepalensis]
MTIRVMLADDQALLRETFRMLIDSCDDMKVVAEAADGRQAVELARGHRPDVVIMDIRMPGTDGLAATASLCAQRELTGTRVIILTTFETDEYVARAIWAGASGFLGKDIGASDLLTAIRTVAAGNALLSPNATRALIARFLATPELDANNRLASPDQLAVLTIREREAMALAAGGHSNEEIAARLVISPLTVRTHLHHAMAKLNVRDRAQLVVIAYQSGLVQATPRH